ncbi:cupin domain-containing protein [Tessaracoccus sp. MC1865]|uniref:cupin domain-containing protein n=1 Tax=Tessaracoccus sp. MC1865 TaxID=2760310 RepID=UPI0016034C14|nr:cupin domain-containing protein [Tessaracoccus sp. MC1865]MBB1482617.1 cupin domain-containing protein [Tessaracoccus sp. MC1865]QTO37932.1 cupin domain-containing protein [Tessaracoccus sp. MC1865]
MTEELRWDDVPQVTRAGQEDTQTLQSGDCIRVSGVGPQHTPATKLWFGKVTNKPGYRSLPHHHGEAETGGYVLKGKGRIYYGPDYAQYVDMEEGDWVWVPPFMPHVECNMSTTDDLIWLTTRTPENLVFNLDDVEDSDLDGYRRS